MAPVMAGALATLAAISLMQAGVRRIPALVSGRGPRPFPSSDLVRFKRLCHLLREAGPQRPSSELAAFLGPRLLQRLLVGGQDGMLVGNTDELHGIARIDHRKVRLLFLQMLFDRRF